MDLRNEQSLVVRTTRAMILSVYNSNASEPIVEEPLSPTRGEEMKDCIEDIGTMRGKKFKGTNLLRRNLKRQRWEEINSNEFIYLEDEQSEPFINKHLSSTGSPSTHQFVPPAKKSRRFTSPKKLHNID